MISEVHFCKLRHKKIPLLVNHLQIACIFRVTFLKERKEIENNPLNNFILDYFCPLWTRHTHREKYLLHDLTQKIAIRLNVLIYSIGPIIRRVNIYYVPVAVLDHGRYSSKKLFSESLFFGETFTQILII